MTGSDEPRPGLRERNKRRKEMLIREAAHRLFNERGYDATTLRAVAEAADVGFGTVFAYAVDKAGLLAMVYVERLKGLPPLFDDRARGDPLDELAEGLAHLYRFWADAPALSRTMLLQMEFPGANPHVDLIVARRARTRGEVRAWLERLRDDRRVGADVDLALAADTLFAIYTSAIREWIAGDPPVVADGVERLRSLLALAVDGLRPRLDGGLT